MRKYSYTLGLFALLFLAACREEPAPSPTPPAEEVVTVAAPATETPTEEPRPTAPPEPTAEPTTAPLADACVDPVYLAIIWHQHQPVYYQDPETGVETGVYVKPWVRLHAAKDYVPREWIGRIDRDRLLETVCLSCGVILDRPASGDEVTCPRCSATNLVRPRGDASIFAALATPTTPPVA